MKKLSTLFGLLVLFLANAVSVKAQTPTADPITSAEVPTGYYFIASAESTAHEITSPYIAANGGTMKLVAQTAVTTDVSSSTVGLWYITKASSGKYTIKSQETGNYWAAGGNAPLGGTPGEYDFVQTSDGGAYYFSGNGGNITNHGYVNATSATAFERNSSGSYNKWKLIPAGVQDVTFNYTAGTRSFSVNKLVATGEVNPAIDFYTNFEPSTVNVVEGTTTYNVTATANFPFEASKYYKLKIRHADSGNRFVVWTGVDEYSEHGDGDNNGEVKSRSAETESNNGLWRFEFVNGTANQVYLCSAVGGAKLAIRDNTNNLKTFMSTAEGTKFCVKKGNTGANYTNGFRLSATNNDNANLNDVNGILGYWVHSNSSIDAGSTFTVYEPTAQPVEKTINTIVATNTATSKTITIENVNATLLTTTSGNDILPHNSYFTLSNGSYNNDTHTYTVDYTTTAPYAISGTTDENKAWQVIRTRTDGADIANCYLKMDGENIKSRNNALDKTTISSICTFDAESTNKWAIIPANGTFSKFYFVNKSDETKKAYLSAENQGTLVKMSSENATGFYLAAQPTFDGITGGFVIQPNNTNKHAIGDHCSGNLGYWSNRGSSELSDAGSIFRIANLVDDCKALVPTSTANIGDFNAEAQASLKADAITTCEAFLAKYNEVKASDASYVAPDPNKLYRITFTRGNVSPALTGSTANAAGNVNMGNGNTPDERRVTFVAQSTNTPSAIVRFKTSTTDNAYLIQDVNSGLYYGSKGDAETIDGQSFYRVYAVQNSEYAGHYAIDYSINGTLTNLGLKNTKESDNRYQYMWSRGEAETNILGSYNYICFHSPYQDNATEGTESTIEAGCVVKVQEVTTYPVSISEAGYASLCLPFSVTLPEGEGLTANKVTSVGSSDNANELNLVSLDGTIAAGEPVILQGEAGSYTLTINPEDGTKTSDNILSGTNVKRTGITDIYYALGYKSLDASNADEKTAGFYKVTTETMPANKAYLLKKNIPAAQQAVAMFSFNFGGNTTGISEATKAKDADSNVYYDLQGRRVLYPAHGIFVKANGQKVFIK